MTIKGQITTDEFVTAWDYVDYLSVTRAQEYFEGTSKEYAEKHGFGYPGEVLERFTERDTFDSLIQIRSMAFAACATSNLEYEFYQEQRLNFAEKLSSTNAMKEDGVLQALATYWRVAVLEQEEDVNFVSLLQSNEDKMAALEFLLAMPEQEKIRHIQLKLLSELSFGELTSKDVYEQVPMLQSLAMVYEFLRPKKGECKGFLDVYEAMMQVWRLSKKELQVDVTDSKTHDEIKGYTEPLQCDPKEFMTIHYLLFSWTKEWAKNAEVAKERIFDHWLKAELTSEHAISQGFQNEMIRTTYSKERVGEKMADWFSEVNCEDNLLFVRSFTNDFVLLPLTPSVVNKLDHPLFNKNNATEYVLKVVSASSYSDFWREAEYGKFDKKRILCLVEEKRLELELVKDSDPVAKSVSSYYLELLVSEGIYTMKTFESWKEMGLRYAYVSYIGSMKKKNPDWYVQSISEIPVEFRNFLIVAEPRQWGSSVIQLDFVKSVFEEATQKETYLSVLMEALYHHKPELYGSTLYEFYKDGVFVQVGLSETEIDSLLEKALSYELFEGQAKRKISEKFMSAEEKLNKEVRKVINSIESTGYISTLTSSLMGSINLLSNSDLQEAIVASYSKLEFDTYTNSAKKLYNFVVNLASLEVFDTLFINRLFMEFDKKLIESKKYSKSDIEYMQHVIATLSNHYQKEATEKENEACKSAV